MSVASFSCTPLSLAGFALLYPVPWFNALVFLAAACYGAWLMYDGLPIVMGIPKDMPEGVDKKGYVKLTAAAKGAAPAWAEEDIFVV